MDRSAELPLTTIAAAFPSPLLLSESLFYLEGSVEGEAHDLYGCPKPIPLGSRVQGLGRTSISVEHRIPHGDLHLRPGEAY
jgi:hypothetical protein